MACRRSLDLTAQRECRLIDSRYSEARIFSFYLILGTVNKIVYIKNLQFIGQNRYLANIFDHYSGIFYFLVFMTMRNIIIPAHYRILMRVVFTLHLNRCMSNILIFQLVFNCSQNFLAFLNRNGTIYHHMA